MKNRSWGRREKKVKVLVFFITPLLPLSVTVWLIWKKGTGKQWTIKRERWDMDEICEIVQM